MLSMLVVATALRFTLVGSRPSNDDNIHFQTIHYKRLFNDNDMSPDLTEQLFSHDHFQNMKKKNEYVKYEAPKKLDDKSTAPPIDPVDNIVTEEVKKGPPNHSEEIDVVDRADHVTQYLADLLVNTDSEITSLQAVEPEDDREVHDFNKDKFFAFLTGQEKVQEVEGVWSKPDDAKNEDSAPNAIGEDD